MQNPLVSIIINCYNGEKYLKKCLQSAIGQTYSNIEIIFWDNLSIDKSIEIAERFRDKKIKIFESSKTTSLGEARNNAIKVSSGDLITFLDVDDWYSPEKIELQVQEFKNDQDIGLVFTNYYYYNDLDKTKKLSISEIGKDNIQQKLLDCIS